LTLGDFSAQLTHAAGESAGLFGAPLPKNTFAVVLAVPDEAGLLKLEIKLAKHGIEYCLIREPDEPFLGQATALGIKPMLRSDISKLLANYPLIRELNETRHRQNQDVDQRHEARSEKAE
jgi:hypothetical protein